MVGIQHAKVSKEDERNSYRNGIGYTSIWWWKEKVRAPSASARQDEDWPTSTEYALAKGQPWDMGVYTWKLVCFSVFSATVRLSTAKWLLDKRRELFLTQHFTKLCFNSEYSYQIIFSHESGMLIYVTYACGGHIQEKNSNVVNRAGYWCSK